MNFQKKYQDYLRYFRMRNLARQGNRSPSPVWLYNFWDVPAEEMWLTRFMRKRGLLNGSKRFSFYSVFGNRRIAGYDRRDVKVFVTGENVHAPGFEKYSDNMLSDGEINLALGFDYTVDARYLRLPLWLRTAFLPEWNEDQIIERVRQLRFPEIGKRSRFACMIARYDWGNTRSRIVKALEEFAPVSCPSTVLHNDDELKSVFHDDKIAYMHQFKFNICPENSNSPGYVTEKIFDSILAGCIPVYWGSDNCPEPDILNHESIVFIDYDRGLKSAVSKVQELASNSRLYDEFAHQPMLYAQAEESILSYFDRLEEALRAL